MNTKNIAMGIVALAIVGLIGVNVMSQNKPSQQANDVMMTVSPSAVNNDVTAMPENTAPREYADGVYSAEGNYTSPAQEESINISLTLEDGIITDATFKGNAVHETSKKMQGLFSEGYKEEVVGKNIDDLKLTVVNGSSLTPKGFNDALEKIRMQASS